MWTVIKVNGNDIQVMGFLFPIQLVFTYLLTFASLFLLVRAYLLSKGGLRMQTGLLLVGILIPVLVSIAADVFGWNPLPHIDEPAFSIVFTVVLFGWATLRFNTFYLLPVASDVIIKNMQEGILVTDIEGLIIYSNPAVQKIFGERGTQINGHPVGNILAQWLPEAFQAWNNGKEEVQLILGEAQPQFFRLTVSQLVGNADETVGSLLTLYNNTDQKNYERRLNELAICDPLTGSYNRRYFYEMAHAYFNQMLRSSKPLSIVMIDLDHFKHINDTFGHARGDLVLQKVAAVCKSLVRTQDIFSRYGGEEFVLAMPETSLRDALMVAERLRRAIEALKNEVESISVTASLGVVETIGEAELTLDVLLNRADEAMYLSKHAGRNRVTAWKN
jgi:diguanylate cyclase (GGDEF)-like protein